MNLEQARQKLEKYGQLHVLDYYEGLTDEQKQELLKQIDETDFSVIRYAENPHGNQVRGKITPLGAMEISEIEKNKEHFTEAGLKALREQKIGAVLLAGGMGTRLGSDDPKCMYDIGITKPVYIMQRLIENLMDVVREAGVPVPLFIMTSDRRRWTILAMTKIWSVSSNRIWLLLSITMARSIWKPNTGSPLLPTETADGSCP